MDEGTVGISGGVVEQGFDWNDRGLRKMVRERREGLRTANGGSVMKRRFEPERLE